MESRTDQQSDLRLRIPGADLFEQNRQRFSAGHVPCVVAGDQGNAFFPPNQLPQHGRPQGNSQRFPQDLFFGTGKITVAVPRCDQCLEILSGYRQRCDIFMVREGYRDISSDLSVICSAISIVSLLL